MSATPIGRCALALLVLALASCSGARKRDPDRNRYYCDDATSFHAEINKGSEEIWVKLPTHAFRMDRVETDVGDMYVRGKNTLSVEEGVATLVLGDGTRLTNCKRRAPGG